MQTVYFLYQGYELWSPLLSWAELIASRPNWDYGFLPYDLGYRFWFSLNLLENQKLPLIGVLLIRIGSGVRGFA